MRSVMDSEHVRANIVSMSRVARCGITVAMLYGTPTADATSKLLEAKYWRLRPASNRDVAEKTREILRERGWSDYHIPELENCECICVSVTQTSGLGCLNPVIRNRYEDTATTGKVISAANTATASEAYAEPICQSIVLEHFDGFVDSIENGMALVTLKSREHGDELLGQYPAAQLTEQGIYEQSRFLCRTVQEGQATRVEIEAISKVVPTEQQIREIENELNRMLPPDDNVDY